MVLVLAFLFAAASAVDVLNPMLRNSPYENLRELEAASNEPLTDLEVAESADVRHSVRSFFRQQTKRPPPGPTPWPILGSMHYLGMYDIPFEGFTYLKKFYGDVFAMRMGSTPCVVLNTPEHRDEAIVAKADDFDGRPNFVRFAHLFGGRSSNCESTS